MSEVLRLFVFSLLLAGSLAAAPQRHWEQLKVGISARQTLTLLGRPLLQCRGKGFETWTYDQGAEVLLYGGNAVVGWTAPASANLPVRSLDVWNLQPTDEHYSTLYSLLQDPNLMPAARTVPKLDLKPEPENTGTGYEQDLRAGKG